MILITGATGFIGRHVVRSLAQKVGAEHVKLLVFEPEQDFTNMYPGIRVTHGSLSDEGKLVQAMEGVDIVLHLASKAIDRDGTGFDEANVRGTGNLCDVAKEYGVKKFLYLSSVGVYGHRPFRDADETTAVQPDTAFSRSKAAAEQIVLEHHRDGDFQSIILRTRFVYGEGDLSVVGRVLKAVKKYPFLLGGGKARFSFVLVNDLAEIISRFAIQRVPPESYPVYHVTDGVPLSYRNMIRVMCDAYGLKLPRRNIPFWLLYYPVRFIEWVFRIDPEVVKFPLSSIRLKLMGQDNFFSNQKVTTLFSDFVFVPFQDAFAKLTQYYAQFL
jgi:nucleoside-diphosphate-sugar epimerase